LTPLKQSKKIWTLAKDLGIRHIDNPVSDILDYCEKKFRKFLKHASDCTTLSELLNWSAAMLGTVFEEIHSDADLMNLKNKYMKMGEKIFAILEEQFTDEVCGITLERTNREHWEPAFVSVIDCRGTRALMAYFTKWHELAHLLILTDQMRLSFKRTLHLPDKDPEEKLVDLIAGKFGFYAPLINPHISGEISFEKINSLRETLCSDASYLASLLGFVKAWPEPCMLILCQKALKKCEQGQLCQGALSFKEQPVPVLRAVRVTQSDTARKNNFTIHRNMRVPEDSVIQSLQEDGTVYAEAIEDLSWWQSSDGSVLPKFQIKVEAKKLWDDIYALISLSPPRQSN
jgi:hypothetical protein